MQPLRFDFIAAQSYSVIMKLYFEFEIKIYTEQAGRGQGNH